MRERENYWKTKVSLPFEHIHEARDARCDAKDANHPYNN